MAADALVDPVADVDRAVGTDGDVGRAEHRLDGLAEGGSASTPHDEVRPRVLLLHVRGHENLARQLEAGAGAHRLIREDLVAAGVGGEEHALRTATPSAPPS